MKILSMHIYGFGQFENKRIDLALSTGIHVFYGENEAGKTTIHAFVHAILFGFPTRNQIENRYEPKTGAKYGGKLSIQVNKTDIITVERVARRASGEIAVYKENGEVGGEEELQYYLKGLNRSIYQSIFSFNMKGLQSIDQVKSTELSQYLFSAGATGSQTLVDIEKKLNRQIEELYKPSGRKPLLNEKLVELEQLRAQLRKQENNIEEYNEAVDRRIRLIDESNNLEAELTESKKLRKEYETKQLIKPYVEERRKWKIQLDQLEDYLPFPINGLDRLQQLQLQIRPLKGQLLSIDQKANEVDDELASFQLQQDYLNYEAKVRALKEQQQAIEVQDQQKKNIILSLDYEQAAINNLLEKLGPAYSERMIVQLDTSLLVKQQLTELIHREDILKEQQKLLDEQLNRAKTELDLNEVKIQRISQASKKPNSLVFPIVLILLTAIIGVVMWFTIDHRYPLIIASILIVGLLLKQTLKAGHNQELEREKIILKQNKQLLEDIVRKIDNWEADFHIIKEELSAFCNSNRLPIGLSGHQLLAAFDLIEDLKRRAQAKDKLINEKNALTQIIDEYDQQVMEFALIFQLTSTRRTILLEEMLSKIEIEKEKMNIFNRLLEKKRDYYEDKQKITLQLTIFEQELNELFVCACVKDEDNFRRKGLVFKETEALESEIIAIESYLQAILKESELNYIEEVEKESVDYEELLAEVTERIHMTTEKMKNVQLQIADCSAELKVLEEGGAYTDLVHHYEAKKSSFEHDAKRWAVYQVARDLIEKTKDYYRDVRLPHVIETAQAYFAFLTKDRYYRVYPPTEARGFSVERADGARFAPNELSQATTEQLYLSLRLALAIHYSTTSPLPVIIDDSFVNFDNKRVERAFELIQQISAKHQVLFFTCHQPVVGYFEGEDIIYL